MKVLTVFHDNHKEDQDDFEDRQKISVANYNAHTQSFGLAYKFVRIRCVLNEMSFCTYRRRVPVPSRVLAKPATTC